MGKKATNWFLTKHGMREKRAFATSSKGLLICIFFKIIIYEFHYLFNPTLPTKEDEWDGLFQSTL